MLSISRYRCCDNMLLDRNGNEVKKGCKVRVVFIDPNVLAKLPKNDVSNVASMLNEVFEVYEVDEFNQAWVEKWWSHGQGSSESHSLGLTSSEIELVESDS